jgi:hypothetical protein
VQLLRPAFSPHQLIIVDTVSGIVHDAGVNKTSRTYPSLKAYVDAQARDVTQADIAERLEISAASLSYYLSKKRYPSSVTALRISKVCGIPLHKLLRDA